MVQFLYNPQNFVCGGGVYVQKVYFICKTSLKTGELWVTTFIGVKHSLEMATSRNTLLTFIDIDVLSYRCIFLKILQEICVLTEKSN